MDKQESKRNPSSFSLLFWKVKATFSLARLFYSGLFLYQVTVIVIINKVWLYFILFLYQFTVIGVFKVCLYYTVGY